MREQSEGIVSKLKASRNTFQKSLQRHHYRTHYNPPPVRRMILKGAELQKHLDKTAKRDETANTRTHYDKVYLGL
jgi:hypothetical protein